MPNFTNPDNLVDPQLLLPYVNAMFGESNKLIQSGIIKQMSIPGLDTRSTTITVPHWKVLGEMQLLNPGDSLDSEGLDDYTQRHPVTRRYKDILNLDLAGVISSGNPNEETAKQINKIFDRAINKSAMATLQGSTAANTNNVVADTSLPPAITDFTALEGVFGDILPDVVGSGFWLMRSKAFEAYRELGLVADPVVGDIFQDDVVAGSNMFGVRGSILGRNIIVDDELYRAGLTSKSSGDALTYLVGGGAIGMADQKAIAIETGRNIAKQADEWVISYHKSVGVDGMDYTATASSAGPDDTALRTSSNYALVAEDNRFVPISSIQTNYPS